MWVAVWNPVRKSDRWNDQMNNQQILRHGNDESFINVREHSAILIIFLLQIEENTTWDIWYKLK